MISQPILPDGTSQNLVSTPQVSETMASPFALQQPSLAATPQLAFDTLM